MNEIVKVLMHRDIMSEIEAKKEFARIRELFHECMIEDGFDEQDFMQEELGLEPDYIFDLF